MNITQLYSTDNGVKEIICEIDELMNSLYPTESNKLLPLSELDQPDTYFIGAVENNAVMACGALVHREDDICYTELKRIYVKPEFRGKKLSKLILHELLRKSAENGFRKVRLETGNKQLEAIKLYESFGFIKRPIFGEYSFDPTSVYMELELKSHA